MAETGAGAHEAQPASIALPRRESGGGIDAGIARLSKLLHAAVNRHKRYPHIALRMRREGTATVLFELRPDGSLLSPRVTGSSGHPLLDRSALRAVAAIAPFGPAGEYLDAPRQFSIDVVFNLSNARG